MSDTSSLEASIRYVLVPVPSEYVLDVMRWVLYRAPQGHNDTGLERAGINQLVEDLSPTHRLLLERVAVTSLRGEPLRMIQLADEMEIDHPKVSTMIAEVNNLFMGAGRDLIIVQHETEVGVFGNVGKLAYLSMRTDHAQMVRNALREVESAPSSE